MNTPLIRTHPLDVAQEIAVFLRMHLFHFLLFGLLAFTAVTLLHEIGHALVVLAVGGEVLELAFLPGGHALGHTSYRLPPGVGDWIVALGPYVMWSGIAACSALWLLTAGEGEVRFGRAIFVWGVAVPFGDIFWAALPWLAGGDNDFRAGLGAPGLDTGVTMIVAMGGAVALAFVAQRAAYGARALSLSGYGALVVAAIGGWGILG
jgi:hypothetical protein